MNDERGMMRLTYSVGSGPPGESTAALRAEARNSQSDACAKRGPRVSESLRDQIESRLEDCKRRNYAEIRSYPSPITACDQQFNYLLDEQRQIAGELARWHSIVDEPRDDQAHRELIAEFLRSSTCLDEATKARLGSCLAPS
jgi:hypothetical protein